MRIRVNSPVAAGPENNPIDSDFKSSIQNDFIFEAIKSNFLVFKLKQNTIFETKKGI